MTHKYTVASGIGLYGTNDVAPLLDSMTAGLVANIRVERNKLAGKGVSLGNGVILPMAEITQGYDGMAN